MYKGHEIVREFAEASHKIYLELQQRPNYKSRLTELNLLPFSYWLECRDLCFMFKYSNGGFDVELKDFVKIASGRTINSTDTLKLYPVHRHRTSLCRDSLFNRIVNMWNNLPVHMRKSSSFISFKSRLNDYCFNKLLSTCDSDRPSTWKQGRRKGGGGHRGGLTPPLPFLKGGRGGGQKCPFIKYTCLIKNEQALAEVIICVKAERGVTARSEILRLYLLQAW